MAANPYTNRKGVFDLARYLRDAPTHWNRSPQFRSYLTDAGYSLTPGKGQKLVESFKPSMINNSGGAGRQIDVYAGKGSGTISGSTGTSGSGGTGGMSDLDRTVANLLEGIGGEMTSYAAGNASLINQVTRSNQKLLGQIAKRDNTTKLLQKELNASRQNLSSMTGRFEDRFAQQENAFRIEVSGLQSAAAEAQANFQRILALSNERLTEAEAAFAKQLTQADLDRKKLQQDYEAQLAETRALANAYVPQMEQSAVAPKLGDDRPTLQARRPRNLQSLSSLSIATPRSLQIA